MAIDQTLARIVESYGVLDFFIPFILVFTIVFAILQQSKILGQKSKNFNVVVALVLGLLFVIPHMTGQYPPGYDPVEIMNEALPSISLVGVSIIMVMILLGLFGGKFSNAFNPYILLISLGFVIYIFLSSLGILEAPNDIFSWWSEETTELMLVIFVFAIIVILITREKTDLSGLTADEREKRGIFNYLKSLIER